MTATDDRLMASDDDASEWGSMDHPAPSGTGSLLDQLGALREHRAAETTNDLPLPGFNGRLWGTFRLPETGRSTQLQAMILGGMKGVTGAACEYLADYCVGLYLADGDAEAPIRDDHGVITPSFQHLPGGTDELPITFRDARLERVAGPGGKYLCPSRAQGKPHQPSTRARSLFGRDTLAVMAALQVNGWAVGGADGGALDEFSERFVGE